MRTKLPRKVHRLQSWCILAPYTISLGPLYHKIPHPPLRFAMPCNLHLEHTYINKENDCKGVVWCVFGQLNEPVYCYTNGNEHIYYWNSKKGPLHSFQASKGFQLKKKKYWDKTLAIAVLEPYNQKGVRNKTIYFLF